MILIYIIPLMSTVSGMGRQAHQTAARYQQNVVMKEWENAYKSLL